MSEQDHNDCALYTDARMEEGKGEDHPGVQGGKIKNPGRDTCEAKASTDASWQEQALTCRHDIS